MLAGIPVRRDDPPHRLTALLVAALGALALLVGGWTATTAPLSTVFATEALPEEVSSGEAVAERRAVRAERRSRRTRAVQRLRRGGLRFRRHVSVPLRRPLSGWRTTPLRGPPVLHAD